MMTRNLCVGLLALALATVSRAADRPDLLVADFEGETYGDWKTTGTAFGPGPARGTLPNQMDVSGFQGKRLVNSYYGGDKSTGTLTSPAFTVQRRYLNFLLGGGHHPGETCINLLHDGKVVRTASGPNDRPGGTERLDWHTWDLQDLAGKSVVLQIVDSHTGGWGHINVDHIVQSDRRLQAEPARRELTVSARYLHLPVTTGAPMRRAKLLHNGKVVREFDIELADGAPGFWAFLDVAALKGQKVILAVDALPAGSKALEAISQGDEIKGEPLYREKYRPQFHFTSRRGWLNDPNGLVYHDGEYHLYYQHNPYGWNWGNMHWGHAVSRDLVHWQELGDVLTPVRYGDWCFSGSAVVDRNNTSGFKSGREDVLVAAFTSTGRGECIVFSNDRGRTWREYDGNPVVRHQGRDPRLLWHAPSKRWVMAVYNEHAGKQWIAFYTSADLKKWTFTSRIEGFFECPDLFELPVEGRVGEARWVLYAADGKYVLGQFDGQKFTTESGKHTVWHGNFYAAQTFSDTPDGRRIQIGWGNGITFPGMPFNQQMTVPCRLTLRPTEDGPRMFVEPVKEIASLRGPAHTTADMELTPGTNLLKERSFGELLDIEADLEPRDAALFGLEVRGVPVMYDVKKQELTVKTVKVPLKLEQGRLRLRVLVDRGSVEVFANGGRAAVSVGALTVDRKNELATAARGGAVRVKSLTVHELKPAW